MSKKSLQLDPPSADDWRELRERHNLTQRALADLVHRTPDAIRKWEAGMGSDLACWHLALMLVGEAPSFVVVQWATGTPVEHSRHPTWKDADGARLGLGGETSIEDSRTWDRVKPAVHQGDQR